MQSDCFLNTTAFYLKKVCYKVSSCENCSGQSCEAFTGLFNRVQMVGGGHPLKHNVHKVYHPLAGQCYHHFGNPMHALFILQ